MLMILLLGSTSISLGKSFLSGLNSSMVGEFKKSSSSLSKSAILPLLQANFTGSTAVVVNKQDYF